MSRRRIPGAELRTLLRPAVSTTTSAQTQAEDLVPALLRGRRRPLVVDLGCGRGDSVDAFRAVDEHVRWIGVELEESEEFAQRTRTDAEFVTFDGTNLPYGDDTVDVVFCKQVLEHVERPDALLADVARVLAPGGAFAGSTSHLEPFHARSTANLTPYGLKRLLERAGLELEAIMPGIDGPTLIARRAFGRARCFDRWWARRSPANAAIDALARLAGWDAEDRNAIKLLLCGQYAFIARLRRGEPDAPPGQPSDRSASTRSVASRVGVRDSRLPSAEIRRCSCFKSCSCLVWPA